MKHHIFSNRVIYMFYIAFILQLSQIATIYAAASASTTSQRSQKYGEIGSGLEISPVNITSNLASWEQDYAIMFYAPWCKYCKTLYTSWEQIAKLRTKPSGHLTIGTFNCEQDSKNTDICQKFGVDRYPSLYYIGYGKFYQHHPSSSMIFFTKEMKNRIVRYNADIYPEALYDWVNMLSTISNMQRRWDDAIGVFRGLITGAPISSSTSSSSSSTVTMLQDKVKQLEGKVNIFSEELEKYKADELFDNLEDHGDPFPLLAQMEPDQQNLPFRSCIAEMVVEYCKYHDEESHCSMAGECLARYNEPKACRPSKCPLSPRGCVVASLCLDTSIIKQYQDALRA